MGNASVKLAPIAYACGFMFAAPALADSARIDIAAVSLEEEIVRPATAGELELLAGFALSSASTEWGGLSGAILTADGRELIVVADIGIWHRLALRHASDGRLTAITSTASGRLKDEQGNPLRSKSVGDAEAIVQGADGSFYVSFEGWHRLWRYRPASDPLLSAAKYVRGPKALASLPDNEGVEAATALPDGRLLLLSEGGRTETGDVRGWLGTSKKWSEISLVPSGGFKPTDLTPLPSGDLLLLERRVSLFGGFAARLSVISAASLAPGARLTGRELAIIESPLPVDNFEAVATRAEADEAVLIYLLSDDNFNEMERTLLLQFRWRP